MERWERGKWIDSFMFMIYEDTQEIEYCDVFEDGKVSITVDCGTHNKGKAERIAFLKALDYVYDEEEGTITIDILRERDIDRIFDLITMISYVPYEDCRNHWKICDVGIERIKGYLRKENEGLRDEDV